MKGCSAFHTGGVRKRARSHGWCGEDQQYQQRAETEQDERKADEAPKPVFAPNSARYGSVGCQQNTSRTRIHMRRASHRSSRRMPPVVQQWQEPAIEPRQRADAQRKRQQQESTGAVGVHRKDLPSSGRVTRRIAARAR